MVRTVVAMDDLDLGTLPNRVHPIQPSSQITPHLTATITNTLSMGRMEECMTLSLLWLSRMVQEEPELSADMVVRRTLPCPTM